MNVNSSGPSPLPMITQARSESSTGASGSLPTSSGEKSLRYTPRSAQEIFSIGIAPRELHTTSYYPRGTSGGIDLRRYLQTKQAAKPSTHNAPGIHSEQPEALPMTGVLREVKQEVSSKKKRSGKAIAYSSKTVEQLQETLRVTGASKGSDHRRSAVYESFKWLGLETVLRRKTVSELAAIYEQARKPGSSFSKTEVEAIARRYHNALKSDAKALLAAQPAGLASELDLRNKAILELAELYELARQPSSSFSKAEVEAITRRYQQALGIHAAIQMAGRPANSRNEVDSGPRVPLLQQWRNEAISRNAALKTRRAEAVSSNLNERGALPSEAVQTLRTLGVEDIIERHFPLANLDTPLATTQVTLGNAADIRTLERQLGLWDAPFCIIQLPVGHETAHGRNLVFATSPYYYDELWMMTRAALPVTSTSVGGRTNAVAGQTRIRTPLQYVLSGALEDQENLSISVLTPTTPADPLLQKGMEFLGFPMNSWFIRASTFSDALEYLGCTIHSELDLDVDTAESRLTESNDDNEPMLLTVRTADNEMVAQVLWHEAAADQAQDLLSGESFTGDRLGFLDKIKSENPDLANLRVDIEVICVSDVAGALNLLTQIPKEILQERLAQYVRFERNTAPWESRYGRGIEYRGGVNRSVEERLQAQNEHLASNPLTNDLDTYNFEDFQRFMTRSALHAELRVIDLAGSAEDDEEFVEFLENIPHPFMLNFYRQADNARVTRVYRRDETGQVHAIFFDYGAGGTEAFTSFRDLIASVRSATGPNGGSDASDADSEFASSDGSSAIKTINVLVHIPGAVPLTEPPSMEPANIQPAALPEQADGRMDDALQSPRLGDADNFDADDFGVDDTTGSESLFADTPALTAVDTFGDDEVPPTSLFSGGLFGPGDTEPTATVADRKGKRRAEEPASDEPQARYPRMGEPGPSTSRGRRNA